MRFLFSFFVDILGKKMYMGIIKREKEGEREKCSNMQTQKSK